MLDEYRSVSNKDTDYGVGINDDFAAGISSRIESTNLAYLFAITHILRF